MLQDRGPAGQALSKTGVLQDSLTAGQGALQDRCAAGQAHYKAGQCETGAHLGISTAGHETSAGYLRLWLSNEHEGQELESLGIEVKL